MQGDLFGEPARDAAQSQWFTPRWLARRLVKWVRPGDRVLEPSCGTGNLIDALLLEGHDPKSVMGVEKDLRLSAHAYERFKGSGVAILNADFLAMDFGAMRFDVVLMNPPFEDNGHMRFVLDALDLAPVVIGVFPASFEFSLARDNELWSPRGAVTHRARMPQRVDYGGDQTPMFDSVALRIARRMQPRQLGEQREVYEEVWRPGDAP